MKALVATVNYILLVDLHTASVQIVEMHRREYYGISWWKNSDSLVLSHSGIANDTLLDLETYANSEKGYLSFNNKQTSCFLSQPHQILCAPNNWIVTTNTGRNCVTLYDPSNDFYKEIRINDIRWDRLGKDNLCGEHFNSVYIKNNCLYILAHGNNKSSYVLEFSYPNCELKNKHEVKHRTGLHNIWVDDSGNMISCNSYSGELMEIKSNEIIWSSGSAFYSRGLAATSDVIVVGESAIIERDNRKNSLSELWLIDRKTLKTLDCIPLGPYGAVHEVRIIDVPDDAHHGKPFKGAVHLEKMGGYLATHRQEKLKRNNLWQENTTLQGLKDLACIVGSFEIKETNWICSRDDNFLLAIMNKKLRKQKVTLSIEYFFSNLENLANQHLSLVVGYRGNGDNNMLAILLAHSAGITELSLWRNHAGTWSRSETLIPEVTIKGQLSVQKNEDQITIICNDAKPITKKFTPDILEGEVGFRALGAQFKNFSVQ